MYSSERSIGRCSTRNAFIACQLGDDAERDALERAFGRGRCGNDAIANQQNARGDSLGDPPEAVEDDHVLVASALAFDPCESSDHVVGARLDPRRQREVRVPLPCARADGDRERRILFLLVRRQHQVGNCSLAVVAFDDEQRRPDIEVVLLRQL